MKDKKREDGWIDAHDLTLAETVLSHIRNGSTQLSAFEETADKLNRTAAACGFRWNKEIRKKYEKEILEAKANRLNIKSQRRVLATISNVNTDRSILDNWDNVLQFLSQQREKINHLTSYTQELEKENNDLKQQLDGLKSPEVAANEDYLALMQILNRARNLGALKVSEAHV